VKDCDITAQTITFQTEEGQMTRQKTEVYSRVMGYHRPTDQWNAGKAQEHRDRVLFQESLTKGTTECSH
jgi:anaerobic ribonucleoside-triphosphate reductase